MTKGCSALFASFSTVARWACISTFWCFSSRNKKSSISADSSEAERYDSLNFASRRQLFMQKLLNVVHFSALAVFFACVPAPSASSMAFRSIASLVLKLLRLERWLTLPFKIIASVSCLPTRIMGLRLDMGSWKIMAILSPRILWNSSSEIFKRSLPSYKISPPSTMALLASMPIIARLVTDLPEPDSPTMASVSPLYKSNDTSRTACTLPAWVRKDITRSLTSSFFSISALRSAQRRVERIPQTVAEQVETEHEQNEEYRRNERNIRCR